MSTDMKHFEMSIFSVPKAFTRHIGKIQRNALRSWSRLPFVKRIILIGDEVGTAAAAELIGATHLRNVNQDVYGTPLLDDVFRQAYEAAPTEWLLYVNGDILLTRRFAESAAQVATTLGPGLIVSRRWNADVIEELSFEDNWEATTFHNGNSPQLFTEWGIDVFLFPKGLFKRIPPFSLGKSYWDNWLVNVARMSGLPVTDITDEATVIHQNHSYAGYSSMKDIQRSQQGLRNFWLAGDSEFGLSTVFDATHILKAGQIVLNQTPTVSIIILHVGSAGELSHCIRAISHQTYPRGHLELIVVDCVDGTAAMAQREFPFVKVTRARTRGVAAAKNKGAAIASGEMLAFIHSNCFPARDWLRRAVAAAQAAACHCIVTCNCQKGSTAHANKSTRPKWGGHAIATLMTAALWRQVGPFDEHVDEDAPHVSDWSQRASAAGIPFVHAGDKVVRRRSGVVSLRSQENRKEANRRARERRR